MGKGGSGGDPADVIEPEVNQSSLTMGSVPILDVALGYYEVFQSGSSVPDVDEYEQVDFAASLQTPRPDNQRRFSDSVVRQVQRTATTGLDAALALPQSAKLHFSHIKGKVQAQYDAIHERVIASPRGVLFRDKLAFVLGVAHTITSAFWLGASPSTIYKLYTAKACTLFLLRFILYRRQKMHYYLFDFCYFANLLLIIQTWALPEWCGLEKTVFAFSMGPLAWSIVAFRNSMIFHSLDKMTSLFLHVFPPLVSWAGRWFPGDPNHWKKMQSCDTNEASIRELIILPWLPYAIWAVGYYLKIFVLSSKKIQKRGYHTLFQYVTKKPKSLFGKMARTLPRWLAPIVFMMWHVIFCACTFVLSWLMWQHYWLNTLFLVAMIGVSAWNGGNYYFEVFVHKDVKVVPQKMHTDEDAKHNDWDDSQACHQLAQQLSEPNVSIHGVIQEPTDPMDDSWLDSKTGVARCASDSVLDTLPVQDSQ